MLRSNAVINLKKSLFIVALSIISYMLWTVLSITSHCGTVNNFMLIGILSCLATMNPGCILNQTTIEEECKLEVMPITNNYAVMLTELCLVCKPAARLVQSILNSRKLY